MFTPSDLYELYQPSTCKKRVWLREKRPELASDDTEFLDLLQRRGRRLEERHLGTLGAYGKPEYTVGDFDAGAKATEALVKANVPVIYQGVLKSPDGRLGAIPDFLILDTKTNRYSIRDAKLAIRLEDHPEIGLQLGFYRVIAEQNWGYSPLLEVVKGDGTLESPFNAPDTTIVMTNIADVLSLRQPTEEPEEPVGWSKCSDCSFHSHCWDRAVSEKDFAVVTNLQQNMWHPLRKEGLRSYEELSQMPIAKLSQISFPHGRGVQRIGDTRAEKILRQATVLSKGGIERVSAITLPSGYAPGRRPVVMFDLENDIFDIDLGVKVYLWGLLVATEKGVAEPSLIVAGHGIEGDKKGWCDFLARARVIFETHGDVPFVHYSSHEKTWVQKYIDRYGDPDGIASRVLKNLWDMYKAITENLVLPIYSYSLKNVEALTDFRRSQEEYGGLWSIVTYDKYLNAGSPQEAEKIIGTILTYNREDLLASLATYEWLERLAGWHGNRK